MIDKHVSKFFLVNDVCKRHILTIINKAKTGKPQLRYTTSCHIFHPFPYRNIKIITDSFAK